MVSVTGLELAKNVFQVPECHTETDGPADAGLNVAHNSQPLPGTTIEISQQSWLSAGNNRRVCNIEGTNIKKEKEQEKR
jgi:hypothetical protein